MASVNGGDQAPSPVKEEAVETVAAVDANGGATGSSSLDDKLAEASELFEKGSKAIKDSDFVEAVDCLSRALEIRVGHYGELAPECAMSYYKYGCALLYKAQEETDPIGNVPKTAPKNTGESVESAEDGASTKASFIDAKQEQADTGAEQKNKDASDNHEEDDNASSDNDDMTEADEEESDLDLAWKMLDVARVITEKNPKDTIEKVNILATLGEVSMEREDFETSLSDFSKAISILERLVEPDNRRVIELNFRICLVLEVSSKIHEAIPYCQKAISLCNSRLQRLKGSTPMMTSCPGENMDAATNSVMNRDESSKEGHAEPSNVEEEIEVLSGISSELEKKLDDLQQAASSPSSSLSEVMKMVNSKAMSSETKPNNVVPSFSSSRVGVINSGFDSPTVSTAATSDNSIRHLGVVGRGVKRAVVTPIPAEPVQKKPFGESSEKTDSITSMVLDSGVQDSEASTM